MNEVRSGLPDIPLVSYQIPDSEEVVYARDYEAIAAHLGAIVASQNAEISAKDQRIAELDELAHTDALTGLPNLRGLERAFDEHVNENAHFALEIIDIVNFKTLNDSAGYDLGDKFLSEVLAKDIFSHVREYDVPAALRTRLGGDEFGTLVVLKQRENVIVDGELVHNDDELSENDQLYIIESRLAESFANHPFVKKFNSFMPDEFKLSLRSHAAIYRGQTFNELKAQANPEKTDEDKPRYGFPPLTEEQREELRQILQQEQ